MNSQLQGALVLSLCGLFIEILVNSGYFPKSFDSARSLNGWLPLVCLLIASNRLRSPNILLWTACGIGFYLLCLANEVQSALATRLGPWGSFVVFSGPRSVLTLVVTFHLLRLPVSPTPSYARSFSLIALWTGIAYAFLVSAVLAVFGHHLSVPNLYLAFQPYLFSASRYIPLSLIAVLLAHKILLVSRNTKLKITQPGAMSDLSPPSNVRGLESSRAARMIPAPQKKFFLMIGSVLLVAGSLYWSANTPDSKYMRALDYVGQNRDREAAALFESAAQAGHLNAMYLLGEMYQHGKGGLYKDCARAMYWYSEGDKRDHYLCGNALALIYEMGECVKQDRKKAIEIFKKYALMGNDDAMRSLQSFSQ